MSDEDLRARTHAEYQLAHMQAQRDQARAYASALWGVIEEVTRLRAQWRKDGCHHIADQIRAAFESAGFMMVDRGADVVLTHRSTVPLFVSVHDQDRPVPNGQRISTAS